MLYSQFVKFDLRKLYTENVCFHIRKNKLNTEDVKFNLSFIIDFYYNKKHRLT